MGLACCDFDTKVRLAIPSIVNFRTQLVVMIDRIEDALQHVQTHWHQVALLAAELDTAVAFHLAVGDIESAHILSRDGQVYAD